MEASSQRAWQGRLALMVMLGVVAAAACALALTMWWKAPAASAQEGGPANEPAFIVRCDFSHRNNDDPIVHPGKRGAAHSHDFFGNTSTNYASTYDTLQAAGTTCVRPADKASYWIPTVSWGSRTLTASRGVFYYRAAGKDPKTIKAHPAELKVIPNTKVSWRCVGGTYSSTPPSWCSNGKLGLRIIAPDCSNGQIDSTDHRSHMAYASRNKCPSTHPIPVPSLRMIMEFPIPTTWGRVTLSSGEASTMHADFYNAWDQAVLEEMVRDCINAYDPNVARPSKCKAPGV